MCLGFQIPTLPSFAKTFAPSFLLSILTLFHILQAGIDFRHDRRTRIIRPVTARLRNSSGDHALLDQISLLHHVDIQPARDVPSNVAMERPNSRVIGVVLDDHMRGHGWRAWLNQLHVSALRVLNVIDGAVPSTGALG